MQLFELLPHATRLVPIADKFFSQRSASEKANHEALAAIGDEVHSSLGQVNKAHEALYRHLQEQSAQIAELSEEMRRARTSIEQHDHRLEALNEKLASLSLWI
jgi:DNA repair ATPase RecN